MADDRYALHLRGWHNAASKLEDEPGDGLEDARSVRVTINRYLLSIVRRLCYRKRGRGGDHERQQRHPIGLFRALGAVITFHRQEQLDQLLTDDDLATLRHLLRKGTPENTLRALASDLAYLEACSQAATGGSLPWPAPEALVLKFIAHHLFDPAEQGRDPAHGMPAELERVLKGQRVLKVGGPHAPATVQRRLSSWASIHRWRGWEPATSAPRVRTALKLAVKAANRRPRRKSERAIVRTVLSEALARCYERTLAGRRDRALLLVAFASGGRRRSEIVRLKVEDVIEEAPVPADAASPQGRSFAATPSSSAAPRRPRPRSARA